MTGDWTPLLFFGRGSKKLSPRAQEALSDYVFRACNAGVVRVEIVGATDTSEIGLANGTLGRQRAEAVAALFPALGFFPTISITDHGPFHLSVPTAMDVSEPQNRRVTLIFR